MNDSMNPELIEIGKKLRAADEAVQKIEAEISDFMTMHGDDASEDAFDQRFWLTQKRLALWTTYTDLNDTYNCMLSNYENFY